MTSAAVTAASGLASPSLAGIITSVASVVTALALLLTAIGVVIPQLRKIKRQGAENAAALETIHTLVNSTLTAALQAELDATVTTLAMMREVSRLNPNPEPATLAAIAATAERIHELRAALADRAATDSALAAADVTAAAAQTA